MKPRHVKTNYKCPTPDGWRLHLVRTQSLQDFQPPAGNTRNHPVILCPGLGSSGAYCFDLSPAVSLADYLAERGWDVWTVELRGNGQSDKPSLLAGRSHWWTIDTHVEKDVPALLRFVLHETKCSQAHFLGHSMGGMILCGVMARVDTTTSKIRSCIAIGSGLFLEESWWRLFEPLMPLSRAMWTIPTGGILRKYAKIMLGPYRIPYIDMLYFYPSNVDRRIARIMMTRNFSNISVGVMRQIATAFGPRGLLSSDGRVVYAEPARLAKVTAPVMFMVGDMDRMCPPSGARKTWEMFGSRDKRFVCMGPPSGFDSHYGHFDALIGKKVNTEVFPLIADFLEHHDSRHPVSKL